MSNQGRPDRIEYSLYLVTGRELLPKDKVSAVAYPLSSEFHV